jgi:hypothetical protein
MFTTRIESCKAITGILLAGPGCYLRSVYSRYYVDCSLLGPSTNNK